MTTRILVWVIHMNCDYTLGPPLATYLFMTVFQLVSAPSCPTHSKVPNSALQFELSKNFAARPVLSEMPSNCRVLLAHICAAIMLGLQGPWIEASEWGQYPVSTGLSPESSGPHSTTQPLVPWAGSQMNQSQQPISKIYIYFRDFTLPFHLFQHPAFLIQHTKLPE